MPSLFYDPAYYPARLDPPPPPPPPPPPKPPPLLVEVDSARERFWKFWNEIGRAHV